ncbi:MAG: ABC transporter permease [Lachnospiraceae bacterium]
MIMIIFEIKKIFCGFAGKITLAILICILTVVSWLAVSSVEYVDADGQSHSGVWAARQLRDRKNEWAKEVNTDLLQQVLSENARVNQTQEYLSEDYEENNKAYAMKQGFSDIREMINCAFSPFREYNYFRADFVSAAEVGKFYENRISNLKTWLDGEAKDMYSEEEKRFLVSQYEILKTPFYYEYKEGWDKATEYAPTMIMLILLSLSFLVAGIFSNEFTLKSDAIFFSSKLGRSKAVLSKLAAGLQLITVVYWCLMLLYSGIVLGILGTDGANCMIQTSPGGWKSFYNLTYAELYGLTLVGGYLGNMVILAAAMLMSAKTHSTVVSVTIPFIIIFLDSFLGGIHALSEILGLMPNQLLQMNMAVKYFNVYYIGNKIMGAVPILLCMYSVIFALVCPFIIRVYKKTQIK